MSIGRLFAVLASVIGVLFAVPTALAAPPVITGAGYENGRAWVTWSLAPGTASEFIQIASSPDTSQGYGPYPLAPDQTSWRGDILGEPGTYYVAISATATTCAEGPPCPSEWSPAVSIRVPHPVIVLGRSIEPVALGMTRARVRELVRPPSGGFDRAWHAEWGALYIVFRGTPRRVVFVYTDSEYYRVKGTRIHVRSSERALRRAIPAARCLTYTFTYEWGQRARDRYCWVGRRVRGRAVTVFDVHRGRIEGIWVGKVRFRNCHPFRGCR